MVSHWIFFLCYACFGKVPSIVSKRLTTHDCGTNCHAWRQGGREKHHGSKLGTVDFLRVFADRGKVGNVNKVLKSSKPLT